MGLKGRGKIIPYPLPAGPLDYWPPVLCKCGNKAGRLTAWSDENPARRFVKCFSATVSGCVVFGRFGFGFV